MSDERAQLRADLEAGRWERLTDPLLPLALLDDPSWWLVARARCAEALLLVAPVESQAHYEIWVARWDALMGLQPLVTAGPSVDLDIARARSFYEGQAGHDAPLAALAVLEQYPSG